MPFMMVRLCVGSGSGMDVMRSMGRYGLIYFAGESVPSVQGRTGFSIDRWVLRLLILKTSTS